MTLRISQFSSLLVLAGFLVLTVGFAHASDSSRLSGSYRVLGKTEVGSETHLRVQLQLSNHGSRDLHIQEIAFWGPPHRHGGSPQACSLFVRPGSSASTKQEFTMLRSEYRRWTNAKRLNLLVAVEGPDGRKATELVRLDQISGGKAN